MVKVKEYYSNKKIAFKLGFKKNKLEKTINKVFEFRLTSEENYYYLWENNYLWTDLFNEPLKLKEESPDKISLLNKLLNNFYETYYESTDHVINEHAFLSNMIYSWECRCPYDTDELLDTYRYLCRMCDDFIMDRCK